MYSILIAFIVLLFLAVAFSLQNAEPIVIHFFGWRFEGSLVVVLLSSLTCGVLLTVLASLPSHIKKSRLISRQQKTIADLQHQLADQQPIAETKEVAWHTPEL